MIMESGRRQGATSPCAACKHMRRRCAQDYCVFAPYFPADEPHKFACVHKVFGASNVNKMLQELPECQRGDAVRSMVYEANARMSDPIYGCAGVISSQQQEIDMLKTQLAIAQAEVVHMRIRQWVSSGEGGGGTATNLPDNMVVSPTTTPASRHTNQTCYHFGMDIVMDRATWGSSLSLTLLS